MSGAAIERAPDRDDAAEIAAFLRGMPFFAALGVEVMAAGDGSVTLEAPLTPAFEAPPGAFAASSLGALGDMAAMAAVRTTLPPEDVTSTLDFTIKTLDRTDGDRLRAVGRSLNAGRRVVVGAADLFVRRDGDWRPCGTLLATGRRIRARG